jgi:hypothetical protein
MWLPRGWIKVPALIRHSSSGWSWSKERRRIFASSRLIARAVEAYDYQMLSDLGNECSKPSRYTQETVPTAMRKYPQ